MHLVAPEKPQSLASDFPGRVEGEVFLTLLEKLVSKVGLGLFFFFLKSLFNLCNGVTINIYILSESGYWN